MENIIEFGKKHKDQHIGYVWTIDPNYCVWLYNQPFIKYEHEEIYKFLESKILNKNEIYIDFGKYKSKPLSYIIKKDVKYLFYLYNLNFVKKNPKYSNLYKVLKNIINSIEIDDYY